VTRRKLTRANPPATEHVGARSEPTADAGRTLELREERLVARKQTRELGTVEVHTEIEHLPGSLEVEAYSEEVEIEHEPVGDVVTERVQPWKEGDGVLVVPVYEEQLVVSKRLILRERIRIRTVATHERRLIEETLRRERLVIDDPDQTGRVRGALE
jgi:uncharacterized protein (TIGR02271 family)